MSGNGEMKPKERIMTFISPNSGCLLSYSEQKQIVAKALQENKITENGELLCTLESRAMYPMVHFSRYRVVDDSEIELLGPNDIGKEFSLQQGIYKECQSYQMKHKNITYSRSSEKAYIFLGYKSLDNDVNKYLLNSWMSWSGAKMIHACLPREVTVHRYVFFHRVTPPDTELFMYLLLVECRNVSKINEMHLLDFVQRMRVERVFGYLTVYKSLLLSPTSALINGILVDKEEYEGKVDI